MKVKGEQAICFHFFKHLSPLPDGGPSAINLLGLLEGGKEIPHQGCLWELLMQSSYNNVLALSGYLRS